jgi:hypothetical protein
MFFTCAAPHTKSEGLSIGDPLAPNTFLLVTIADPDWRIIVLFIQQSSLAYEKQGASIYLYPAVTRSRGLRGLWYGGSSITT